MTVETVAAATTSTRISDTLPLMEVWYILVDSNNTPLGEPRAAYLGYTDSISQLMMAIQGGPYKDDLAHINIKSMEVWRFPSLSLNNVRLDQIGDLVGCLTFSGDNDGEIVSKWTLVKELQLQQFQPLVVRIIHKGMYLFLHNMFP